jgi:hypothetical protein
VNRAKKSLLLCSLITVICSLYKIGVLTMKTNRMALLGVLLVLAAGLFAQEMEAEFISVNGTVEIQRSGAEEMLTATAGMKVYSGDLVSTGFRSMAQLKIGDAMLTVQPLTRLTLDEIISRGGRNTAGITLRSGRVRAEVTPPSERTDFTVRAPVATASVRGDIYEEDGVYVEDQ